MSEQLGLFAAAPPEVQEAAQEGRFCGWLPERRHPDLQPCVRMPGHTGRHVVWRQGRVDVVVWQTDGQGGVELFRGRVGGMSRTLRPVDVFQTYEAAAGFAEELAREASEEAGDA